MWIGSVDGGRRYSVEMQEWLIGWKQRRVVEREPMKPSDRAERREFFLMVVGCLGVLGFLLGRVGWKGM